MIIKEEKTREREIDLMKNKVVRTSEVDEDEKISTVAILYWVLSMEVQNKKMKKFIIINGFQFQKSL